MSIFSKVFGKPRSTPEALPVPAGARASEIIAIAIRSVVQQAGGNCATLEVGSDSDKWVQLMGTAFNGHYPHREDPTEKFSDLCSDPIVAGVEDYEADLFMTASLKRMDESELTAWIERYFAEVLSIDLDQVNLSLRMERM